MITLFHKKENCCGCTACMNICPERAISMKPDEEGFLYPKINYTLCTGCSMCKEACAFQNGYDMSENLEIPEVYAVKHKSDQVRMTSTSGGMFTAISDCILEKCGIIYGVAYDDQLKVCHMRAENVMQRDKFKGSKYVQSDLLNVFKLVKCDLEADRYVLFTGTPCQVGGLKSYLSKVRNIRIGKLFTCDIVCHGVPSPLLFRKYIEFCEHKNNSRIVEYYHRSKAYGWGVHTEMSIYDNGKEDYKSALSQSWKHLFYSNNIFRPSCHYCKYTNYQRPSDITIADFWGIEKKLLKFNDKKGISLTLVNTKKGEDLFEQSKGVLEYCTSNVKDCMQRNLKEPTVVSQDRHQFWQDYYNNGFDYIAHKYAGLNYMSIIKFYIKKALFKE